MLPLLVLLGTIAGAWYLLIVRPQKDQQTRHGRLVERLQVGDHVLTVGGIYGRVVAAEGATVVLELAPGLTSRIATDGIARIVHDGEASLPSQTPVAPQAAHPIATQTTEPHMQHPPHQHPHLLENGSQPGFTAPAPLHAPAPVHPHAPQSWAPGQPPAQLPPPAPPGNVTLRAHVGPAQTLAAPRPWATPPPVLPTLPALAGRGPALQALVPQTMPAMPLHVPFAGAPAPQPTPQLPAQPAPVYGAHAAQHPQPYAPPHTSQPVAAPAATEAPARRISRAPQGMGSSLRLDDPSLCDTMSRARQERSSLADEYRRVVAPLVDVGDTAVPLAAPAAAHPGYAQPQLPPASAGMAAPGPALFAAGGTPPAQYPAPMRPPVVAQHEFPRPARPAPEQPVQAFDAAFQRRTPLTAHGSMSVPAPALPPATPVHA